MGKFEKGQTFGVGLDGLDTASAILPMRFRSSFGRIVFVEYKSPVWQSPKAMILRQDLAVNFKRYLDFVVILMREFAFIDREMRNFTCHKFFNKGFHICAVGNDLTGSFPKQATF